MADQKPTPQQIKALAKQINKDQKTSYPAEKRFRLNMSFKQAIKMISRTAPPKDK
jgi:hypothetical protein